MPAKKYVIFYRPDPSNFEKAGELFPAHVEHYEAFQKQGALLSFGPFEDIAKNGRSEEHTSELQSLMRTSYVVFCLNQTNYTTAHHVIILLHNKTQRDIPRTILSTHQYITYLMCHT